MISEEMKKAINEGVAQMINKDRIKQQAEDHRQKLIKTGEGMNVPHRTAAALARWAVYAGPGGHFISAVLENDFARAATRADLENGRHLQDIALFLYNYLPDQCWGSKDQVENWTGLYQQNLEDESKNHKEALAND